MLDESWCFLAPTISIITCKEGQMFLLPYTFWIGAMHMLYTHKVFDESQESRCPCTSKCYKDFAGLGDFDANGDNFLCCMPHQCSLFMIQDGEGD